MQSAPTQLLRANAEKKPGALSLCLPDPDGGLPVLTVSAFWSPNRLRLLFSPAHAGSLELSCGSLTLSRTLAPRQTSLELPARETGIPIVDLGQRLPLRFRFSSGAGRAVFDGCLLICDESILCELPCRSLSGFDTVTVSTAADEAADMSGFCIGTSACGAGLRLYDRYGERNDPTSNQTLTARLLPSDGTVPGALHFSCELRIDGMPVTEDPGLTPIGVYARGLCFLLCDDLPFFFGLWRTPAGLCFFLNDGWRHQAVHTGKSLGEAFLLEVIWRDRTLTCYADGIPLADFTGSTVFTRAEAAPHSLMIRTQRREPARDRRDDFDIVLRSLSVTRDRTVSVLSGLPQSALIGAELPHAADDHFPLTCPLHPAKKLPSNAYGLSADIRWESSAPSCLDREGRITRPREAGIPVTLTARLCAAGCTVSERPFRFFLPAVRPAHRVLLRRNDSDPYTGAAEPADCYLILNRNDSSAVCDLGRVETVTNAVLTPEIGSRIRVNKSFFALYASEDNRSYRRIARFCVLNQGHRAVFYRFRVRARYLKLHSVAGSVDAPIGGSLGRLFCANAADDLFAGTCLAVWEPEIPRDAPRTDAVLSFLPEQLPPDPTGYPPELSGLRFFLDDVPLPHTVMDGRLYLRFDTLSGDAPPRIRILRGSSADTVDNPEEVFEIRYGTRRAAPTDVGGYWVNTVERMPDGDLLRLTADGHRLLSSRSRNAGRTWSDWQEIPESRAVSPLSGGGLITDPERGLVCYIGHGMPDREPDHLTQFVMRSTDSGKSWSAPQLLPALWKWALSYSDGIRLRNSQNGVELLFSYCGSGPDGCACSALYSRDAGKSWEAGRSTVRYGDPEAQSRTHNGEGGCSEETVFEQPDGTVVLWSRYETTADEPHFAVSHSHDSGITWEPARLGNLYTSNTQPVITVCRGVPILLWGGNNAMGASSHMRFPLSVAYSEDEAESFHGIQNLIFASRYADLTNRFEVTNPDLALTGYQSIEHAYIVAKDYCMLIEDFADCIFRTKGAYDDFTLATPAEEGWIAFAGRAENAFRDGTGCMRLRRAAAVSRSLPQLENGCILLTLRLSASAAMTLELQTAYADHPGVAAPVTLSLCTGEAPADEMSLLLPPDTPCTLHFELDSRQGLVTLTCGNTTELFRFDPERLPGVCCLNLWSTAGCCDVLRFVAIDREDHTIPKKGTAP